MAILSEPIVPNEPDLDEEAVPEDS
jgi:hypothetical protein